jgi:BirA family biotin operon repressor/biotin-[acetyl-CoA-carboxylase] ligase
MDGMPSARSAAAAQPQLNARLLNDRLVAAGRLWTDIRSVAATGSTNADVMRFARAGVPEGLVITAETQTAGRGRQGRSWHSEPGSALMFSLLVRPRSVAQAAMGWLPLLAGVATATAVRSVTGVRACLKWPNDVLIEDGKLAGILAERSGDAVVVGIGLNVLGRPGSLPVPTATSLELHGARDTDRAELLGEVLGHFERWYLDWTCVGGDADASGLRARYLRLCRTIGKQVNVALPGGRTLSGVATDVDASGQLIVESGTGAVPVSAGDVIHVR